MRRLGPTHSVGQQRFGSTPGHHQNPQLNCTVRLLEIQTVDDVHPPSSPVCALDNRRSSVKLVVLVKG